VNRLPDILAKAELKGASLLVFPFNAFGNLPDGEAMLEMLQMSGLPFVISTYRTDSKALKLREEYYLAAGIEDMVIESTARGLRFTDNSGFDSIAYSEEWFNSGFSRLGMTCNSISFGKIGVAYTNF
jgi:hypothetical protein